MTIALQPATDFSYARVGTIASVVFFTICAGTYVVNAADRVIFPVLLRSINLEYHFTLAQGGLLATIFLLIFICSIRRQLHSLSPCTTYRALTCIDLLSLPIAQKYLSTRCALTSPAPPTGLNLHSLFAAPLPCGSARALPPDAISCLGAFQPPVV